MKLSQIFYEFENNNFRIYNTGHNAERPEVKCYPINEISHFTYNQRTQGNFRETKWEYNIHIWLKGLEEPKYLCQVQENNNENFLEWYINLCDELARGKCVIPRTSTSTPTNEIDDSEE
jgi:hypothetical protein